MIFYLKNLMTKNNAGFRKKCSFIKFDQFSVISNLISLDSGMVLVSHGLCFIFCLLMISTNMYWEDSKVFNFPTFCFFSCCKFQKCYCNKLKIFSFIQKIHHQFVCWTFSWLFKITIFLLCLIESFATRFFNHQIGLDFAFLSFSHSSFHLKAHCVAIAHLFCLYESVKAQEGREVKLTSTLTFKVGSQSQQNSIRLKRRLKLKFFFVQKFLGLGGGEGKEEDSLIKTIFQFSLISFHNQVFFLTNFPFLLSHHQQSQQ